MKTPKKLPKGVSKHGPTGKFFGRATVKLRDGTTTRLTTQYFKVATEAADALGKAKRRAESLDPEVISLGEFLARYMAHIKPDGPNPQKPRVRESTYANRLQCLAPLLPPPLSKGRLKDHVAFTEFRSKRVRDFDESDLRTVLDRMALHGMGSRTVQMAYEALRAAWKYGTSRRIVDPRDSPFVFVERPEHEAKTKDALTEKEAAKLLDAIRAATVPRSRALLLMLVTTGMRVSEALGLTWENVDLENGIVHVRAQLAEDGELAPLKTKESRRTLHPADEVMEALSGLSKSARSEFVFETTKGKPLDRNNVRNEILHPALERAGLSGRLTVHDLRHLAATLAAAHMDSLSLMKMLGHSSLKMTAKVYVAESEAMREAAKAATTKALERLAAVGKGARG